MSCPTQHTSAAEIGTGQHAPRTPTSSHPVLPPAVLSCFICRSSSAKSLAEPSAGECACPRRVPPSAYIDWAIRHLFRLEWDMRPIAPLLLCQDPFSRTFLTLPAHPPRYVPADPSAARVSFLPHDRSSIRRVSLSALIKLYRRHRGVNLESLTGGERERSAGCVTLPRVDGFVFDTSRSSLREYRHTSITTSQADIPLADLEAITSRRIVGVVPVMAVLRPSALFSPPLASHHCFFRMSPYPPALGERAGTCGSLEMVQWRPEDLDRLPPSQASVCG
ncbi:hypothetical protein R3P38DRAFT_3185386 [Favolaschia claudopus]|uniref:Uncharacterized protein n=1 Tax=Favolaschia claudopus TaxID=2862362 RepID=A0AAW0C3X1_9AGAR